MVQSAAVPFPVAFCHFLCCSYVASFEFYSSGIHKLFSDTGSAAFRPQFCGFKWVLIFHTVYQLHILHEKLLDICICIKLHLWQILNISAIIFNSFMSCRFAVINAMSEAIQNLRIEPLTTQKLRKTALRHARKTQNRKSAAMKTIQKVIWDYACLEGIRKLNGWILSQCKISEPIFTWWYLTYQT